MMTIGQFAHASGLTPKALRFYDEKGLLTPYEVDQHSAYRRYAPAQLRRAATIKVMRQMGMSLGQVREALDNPDRCTELVEKHRERVAAQHAVQMAAITHGSAVLASYDQPVNVHVRTAGAQSWVGAVMDIDPGNTDPEQYNTAFARLARGLQEAGNPPVGPFWTTICADTDGRGIRLLTCWPVAAPIDADFAVDGLHLEHGVLPERNEAFVRLRSDDPHFSSGTFDDPAPHPQLLALLEHIDQGERDGGGQDFDTIRQVGVLDEDGTPTAIELTVTTGEAPSSPARHER